jgi:hypothetical protein
MQVYAHRDLVILSVAKDFRAEHDDKRWSHSLPRCFTLFSMIDAGSFARVNSLPAGPLALPERLEFPALSLQHVLLE